MLDSFDLWCVQEVLEALICVEASKIKPDLAQTCLKKLACVSKLRLGALADLMKSGRQADGRIHTSNVIVSTTL